MIKIWWFDGFLLILHIIINMCTVMDFRKIFLSVAAGVVTAVGALGQVDTTVMIRGNHGLLSTRVQVPAEGMKGRVPVAVMCHGFMGNKNGPLWDGIVADLNARGIATVRFDFNGHGDSEGRFEDMTVPNEIADTRAVIEWVMGQPYTRDVALVGHSQGGVVAAMTAGLIGYPGISAVALLAPAGVLRDDALRGNVMGAMFDPWNVPSEGVNIFGRVLGRGYIEAARELPIYETARRYSGPMIVVHGMADRVVPYTYGERFAEGRKRAKFVAVPGEDHGFMMDTKGAARMVADFLTNALEGKHVVKYKEVRGGRK